MLKPDTQMIAQNWPKIACYLAGHQLDVDISTPPRQFSGGLANLNYLIKVSGAPAVFRRPPPGPLAAGANDMAREAKVLAKLPAVYPLAPALLHFCADTTIIGVPFQLIAYRAGMTVGATLPAAITQQGDACATLTRQTVLAMAALHGIEPARAGLEALGKPDGFLVRQISGWRKRAAAAYDGDVPPVCLAILDHLTASLPTPGSAVLLHGDFKPDNMLFDPASLDARAVIDWDMCTLGPALFDLGVLLAYWIEPADPVALHALQQVPSLCAGALSRRAVALEYLTAAGRTPENLSFYLLLGRLRLAIAWQQLYRAHQLGHMTDARYASFNILAEAILAHAWLNRFDPVI
jgi:aminoglycoside phosphotransferase (APT) family kinase protein